MKDSDFPRGSTYNSQWLRLLVSDLVHISKDASCIYFLYKSEWMAAIHPHPSQCSTGGTVVVRSKLASCPWSHGVKPLLAGFPWDVAYICNMCLYTGILHTHTDHRQFADLKHKIHVLSNQHQDMKSPLRTMSSMCDGLTFSPGLSWLCGSSQHWLHLQQLLRLNRKEEPYHRDFWTLILSLVWDLGMIMLQNKDF